jgi:hypothetical protein
MTPLVIISVYGRFHDNNNKNNNNNNNNNSYMCVEERYGKLLGSRIPPRRLPLVAVE